MRFYSTRKKNHSISLPQAIIAGISPDGGLFFPETLPRVTSKQRISFEKKTFSEIATDIFQLFCEGSFSRKEIEHITQRIYTQERFSHPDIAPVVKKDKNTFLLELFHGPTGAFKDFSLQFLPHIFRLSLEKQGIPDQKICILIATSGDTGGAGLAGFSNIPGCTCIVFFPKNGVSSLQKAQMQCCAAQNISVIEADGDFDVLQKVLKNIFIDTNFQKTIDKKYTAQISSANSINIGRLLPQIFYPFAAHAQMVRSGEIQHNENIDVCVPTGNFGDLFATFLAKKMGLPIGKMICATNTNNTIVEFLNTGTFSLFGKSTTKTKSPAMDILQASNLERILFCACGQNSNQVQEWQQQLQKNKTFTVDTKTLKNIQQDFAGEYISDTETMHTIDHVFRDMDYIIDPHTAVGMCALEKYRQRTDTHTKTLVYSTAHYGKFGKTVFEALFPDTPLPDTETEILQALQLHGNTPALPQEFLDILKKSPHHSQGFVGSKTEICDHICSVLSKASSGPTGNKTRNSKTSNDTEESM